MKIEHLGELTIHPELDDWLQSPEVRIEYFDGVKLKFVFEDITEDPKPDDYRTAVSSFLAMTLADRENATLYVHKNYADFINDVDEEDVYVRIDDCSDVWKHVFPTVIHVSRRPYGDKKVYIVINAECDWEIEHGLQIVYREGGILQRVSDQDGHLTYCDARNLPESEDRIC
jgi:hypothetical protein